MPDIIIAISPKTHRALLVRAARRGRSIEAEARSILDVALHRTTRVKLGQALAALVQPLGGLDLDISRDKKPAEPITL
jgi:plasmid stability protein